MTYGETAKSYFGYTKTSFWKSCLRTECAISNAEINAVPTERFLPVKISRRS